MRDLNGLLLADRPDNDLVRSPPMNGHRVRAVRTKPEITAGNVTDGESRVVTFRREPYGTSNSTSHSDPSNRLWAILPHSEFAHCISTLHSEWCRTQANSMAVSGRQIERSWLRRFDCITKNKDWTRQLGAKAAHDS